MTATAPQPATDPAESSGRHRRRAVRGDRRAVRGAGAGFTDQPSGLVATAPPGRLVRDAGRGLPRWPAGGRSGRASLSSGNSGLDRRARFAAAAPRAWFRLADPIGAAGGFLRWTSAALALRPGVAAVARRLVAIPPPPPAQPDAGNPAGAGRQFAATRAADLARERSCNPRRP